MDTKNKVVKTGIKNGCGQDVYGELVEDMDNKKHETHSVCDNRLKKEGGKATCCHCNPHKDCGMGTKTNWEDRFEFLKMTDGLAIIYSAYPENVTIIKKFIQETIEIEKAKLIEEMKEWATKRKEKLIYKGETIPFTSDEIFVMNRTFNDLLKKLNNL